MAFDPDKYLAETNSGFDPDAYLAGQETPAVQVRRPIAPMQDLSLAERAALLVSQGLQKTEAGQMVADLGELGARQARGFVQGQADPVVGAVQFGANLLGQGDAVNRFVTEQERKNEMLGTSPVARVAGNITSLPMIAAARAIPVLRGPQFGSAAQAAEGVAPKLGRWAGNAAIGAGAGLAVSPLSPVAGKDYWRQKELDATYGPLIGGAASAVLPAVGKIIGHLRDVKQGNFSDLRAAEGVRSVLGDKADEILTAIRNAPDDVTAAQAAYKAGVSNDQLAALDAYVRKFDKQGVYTALDERQAAGRIAGIEAQTPDLARAEDFRTLMGKKMYSRAFEADKARQAAAQVEAQAREVSRTGGIGGVGRVEVPLDPRIAPLTRNPILAAAAEDVATANPQIGNPFQSLEGLHRLKAQLDAQFKSKAPTTALARFDEAALSSARAQLLDTLDNSGFSPLYREARERSANLAKPINQAKVLGEMRAALTKSASTEGELGERAMPFLNMTQEGQPGAAALLKRADQNPRFAQSWREPLAPIQQEAVSQARQEITRDLAIKAAAKRGNDQMMADLLDARWDARLPSFFNKWVTALNNALTKSEAAISKGTISSLVSGMKSGRSLNELLAKLPSEESDVLIRVMAKEPQKFVPGGISALQSGNQ